MRSSASAAAHSCQGRRTSAQAAAAVPHRYPQSDSRDLRRAIGEAHGLDPERLSQELADEGVSITFQEEGRLLRAGVGMFNSRDDVDRLLGVIRRLV